VIAAWQHDVGPTNPEEVLPLDLALEVRGGGGSLASSNSFRLVSVFLARDLNAASTSLR